MDFVKVGATMTGLGCLILLAIPGMLLLLGIIAAALGAGR